MTESPETMARRIFAERAAFYTTSAAHKDPQVLARMVALASPLNNWRVLDVATGTGHTAFAFSPQVAHVIATDITPEMLDQARKLQVELGIHNVEFRVADAQHLPFDPGTFDLVTSRRAPHHFSDIHLALSEMHRVLRVGGKLVIDDRSVAEDDFVDECMNELDRYHDPSHVRQYRPSEWQTMLEAAGFTIESIQPYQQHRPLTSLTLDAGAENIALIQHRLEHLDEGQRQALNLVAVNGETYINHWYVMIAATR